MYLRIGKRIYIGCKQTRDDFITIMLKGLLYFRMCVDLNSIL